MNRKINPVKQIVQEAVEKGSPLAASEIRALRAKSRQASAVFKGIFWVGIVIFNLALWVPLPIVVSKMLLYVIAFVSLVIALVVPIFGLRKHQVSLELLKVNKEVLKKKTASEAGRVYIEQVKKQDRPLINAEFELLSGSKWRDRAEDS